jgi:hypothetical protein
MGLMMFSAPRRPFDPRPNVAPVGQELRSTPPTAILVLYAQYHNQKRTHLALDTDAPL